MRRPVFWFVAGEMSGDARAAEVMRALREIEPTIRFVGAGGPLMASLSEAPFDNWAAQAGVVGLWDVLRNYAYFHEKFHIMLSDISLVRPEAVVLVDYPGFNLRLAKALRYRGFEGKILHYISPQVWAWNRSRIPKMARLLDLMICVFPFEAPMYEASGLHTVFVGHPLLEALTKERAQPLDREENLVGLFPGSRDREVKRNYPVMVEAASILSREMPGLRFAASAANENLATFMRSTAPEIPVEVGTARRLMRQAVVGIVCSGTATLEAAFFGLPYCLIYKAAWLTFEIGRRLVDVNCLGIINILNNYITNPPSDPRLTPEPAPHVVREFIQHDATPENLAAEVLRLLQDPAARSQLSDKLLDIAGSLAAEGASQRSAEALLLAARSHSTT